MKGSDMGAPSRQLRYKVSATLTIFGSIERSLSINNIIFSLSSFRIWFDCDRCRTSIRMVPYHITVPLSAQRKRKLYLLLFLLHADLMEATPRFPVAVRTIEYSLSAYSDACLISRGELNFLHFSSAVKTKTLSSIDNAETIIMLYAALVLNNPVSALHEKGRE